LYNIDSTCKIVSCTSTCSNSTCVFFAHCVCFIFFSDSSVTTNSVSDKNIKRLTLFGNLLICYMFDNNMLFENSATVITLFLLKYRSNDISFVCQKFDNNILLESLAAVTTFSTLSGNSKKSVVFNIWQSIVIGTEFGKLRQDSNKLELLLNKFQFAINNKSLSLFVDCFWNTVVNRDCCNISKISDRLR